MDIEKLLTQELARQEAYKGLANCYNLPKEELVNTLEQLEQAFKTLESGAGSPIALMHKEIKDPKKLDTLKVEYARLFVGPYSMPAPPYGSVYLEDQRRVMGDSTMDVQKKYAQAGLTLSEKFKDNPDHIMAELEFMYFLIFKEIQAIQGGSFETVSDCLLKQRSFLQDHLGAWVKEFTQKIQKHSQNSFYRGLAMATHAFICEDFDEIAELVISEPNLAVNLG